MRRPSAYRLFITRNSEYHVRGSVCCAVRDRRTGAWMQSHAAVGRPLADAFADASGRVRSASIPMIGEPLVFVLSSGPVRTSAVLSVEEREGFMLAPANDAEHLAPAIPRRRRTGAPVKVQPRPPRSRSA